MFFVAPDLRTSACTEALRRASLVARKPRNRTINSIPSAHKAWLVSSDGIVGVTGIEVEQQNAFDNAADDVRAALNAVAVRARASAGRKVVEGRATGKGNPVNTGEHFVTAEILGHESSLRCGRLLDPPAVPQCGVLTIEDSELVVRAETGDHAVNDHTHAVGVVRRVKTVGDGDHRATREDSNT